MLIPDKGLINFMLKADVVFKLISLIPIELAKCSFLLLKFLFLV